MENTQSPAAGEIAATPGSALSDEHYLPNTKVSHGA